MTIARPIVRQIVRPIVRGLTGASDGGKREIDLFVIVGQSNAEGRGDSSLSPAAPNGRYISGSTITNPLADPVGGASTGSMWPAFSNEWVVQQGRLSAFVECATGDTSLLAAAAGSNGNWSPTGTLRAAAASAANTAIAAINASPFYRLGNVYFLWSQGETDAQAVNGTTVTGALYEQALEDLATYFKAQVPEMVSMAVIRTAGRTDFVAASGFFDIRAAQESACDDSDLLTMAYRGTYSFRALGYTADSVHYSQAGLNLAGKCAATGLVTPETIPAISPFIAAETYPDTVFSAPSDPSRTVSHTTAVGTTFLIVAVSWMRPSSSSVIGGVPVTAGGVSMLSAIKNTAVSSSPAARVNSLIYYIDEATYGGSLDNVTLNITASDAGGNFIEIVAIDARDIEYLDNTRGVSTTASATVTADLSTGAPALTVAIASAAAASASALTATLTGGLTELMDTGGSNGTRAGQCVVGYREDADSYAPTTIGATFSASCDCAGVAIASFRKKWNGE